MTKHTVYLCGPIAGCDDSEAHDWRDHAKARLWARRHESRDPMRRDYRGRTDGLAKACEIVELDKVDIAHCDVILVNWRTDKSSTGTTMEVIHAWERNKLIVVVHAPDAILSPWLVYHSHKLFTSFDEAIDFIVNFD